MSSVYDILKIPYDAASPIEKAVLLLYSDEVGQEELASKVAIELSNLRYENKKLREALEEISKRSWCSECSSADIAIQTLGGEK